MMVGIGMIGVVTGTVTSLFTREETSEVPPELAYVRDKIEQYPELNASDYDTMIAHLRMVQNEKGPPDN